MYYFENLFYINSLSILMMVLVGFVAVCVASFSWRYLKGDRQQMLFYGYLGGMVLSVFLMVSADHLLLLLCAWGLSNILLVRLIGYKSTWLAARESSLLALRTFSIGFTFLLVAFVILYGVTGETSLRAIHAAPQEPFWFAISSLMILLAAMTQSSLWPFHSWLISSLNSPTPVSAMMHAGLVNGGGFLLARFAPLFLEAPQMLNMIFIVGILTALVGTLWKLMQSDIKRMLACSTMGQMGFMFVQCGLGLFPAAIAHLCCHGLFKAYLFMASGSAGQEKRFDCDYPPSLTAFLLALSCGVLGACVFSIISSREILTGDTNLFLIAMAIIAGTQFALPLVRECSFGRYVAVACMTACIGAFYGGSVYLFEHALLPLGISHPQPLNILHMIGLIALIIPWLAILFVLPQRGRGKVPDSVLSLYVRMLNASQPHHKTVTAYRNHYQF